MKHGPGHTSFYLPPRSHCHPNSPHLKCPTPPLKATSTTTTQSSRTSSIKMGTFPPSRVQSASLSMVPAGHGGQALFYFRLFPSGHGPETSVLPLGSCVFPGGSGPLVLDIQGHSSDAQPHGLLPFSVSGPGEQQASLRLRDADESLLLLGPTPASPAQGGGEGAGGGGTRLQWKDGEGLLLPHRA